METLWWLEPRVCMVAWNQHTMSMSLMLHRCANCPRSSHSHASLKRNCPLLTYNHHAHPQNKWVLNHNKVAQPEGYIGISGNARFGCRVALRDDVLAVTACSWHEHAASMSACVCACMRVYGLLRFLANMCGAVSRCCAGVQGGS